MTMAELYAELERIIERQNKTTDPVEKQECEYEIANVLAELGV